MDRAEYIKNLQEIASAINPLDMVNHCLVCPECELLLQEAQVKVNQHMNQVKK